MAEQVRGRGAFVVCLALFLSASVFCAINYEFLIRPLFEKETAIETPSSAKYEKDGNIYVIDEGSFRILCMTPQKQVVYTVTIDKTKEYGKIFDTAVDEAGNLYAYIMEIEYDAFLTKRDIIRKYDKHGKFVKDVLVTDYQNESVEDRPHSMPRFGSMRCVNSVLSFSNTRKDSVVLYMYDTSKETTESRVFSGGFDNYGVGRLCVKDFSNFIYSTRQGDVYEVKDGAGPVLRASFDFVPEYAGGEGGIIPWNLDYGPGEGEIIFADMASGTIMSISANGNVSGVLPGRFFNELYADGERPQLTGFGFWRDRFSGVFGERVWFYNGAGFTSYDGALKLPERERLAVTVVQILFALGAAGFFGCIIIWYLCFAKRFVSIFLKHAFVIIPVTLASLWGFYTTMFGMMTERLNNEIFKELKFAVSIASGMINANDIINIKNLKDADSTEYISLSHILENIVDHNQSDWSKLFYAATYVGNNFEYHLASSNKEFSIFRPASYMSKDSDTYMTVAGGGVYGGAINYLDGVWLYADKGIFNPLDGNPIGIFEIGLDMTSYDIANKAIKRRVSFFAAAACLAILLVLLIVTMNIVGQLRTTVRVLSAIGRGEYGARLMYDRRDELGRVASGLNNMAGDLQRQFEYINGINAASLRFVPIQFMESLGVRDISSLRLGDNVRRNLSILFFDIRFFSINSEMLSTKENFLFINKVLGTAGPIFRKHNGFVDKYMGDAAMVLFGNAADSVRAGIELYDTVVLSKETRMGVGGDSINIGVGIHSGMVMMGIVGDTERLSSTVISPNVNMASRLESLTKQTKSGVLVSRETMNQMGDDWDELNNRFLGMVQAAGVNDVTGIYDMLDALPEPVRKKRLGTKLVFESGIRKYHTKDYPSACKRFESVIKEDPEDECAKIYLRESLRHVDNPELPSIFSFSSK